MIRNGLEPRELRTLSAVRRIVLAVVGSRIGTAVAGCAVLMVLVAGCNGGTVDRHALTNDSASVASMACEGALLARDIAAGKTTANYAREQAEELKIQSSNLANALAKRRAVASILGRVRAKARGAKRLSETLQRLQDHPSDHRLASAVEQRLKQLGGCG